MAAALHTWIIFLMDRVTPCLLREYNAPAKR